MRMIMNKFPTIFASPEIYGVEWDKSSSSALTRTDKATHFSDPIPYVNNGTGSSPFDNIMPWSGIVPETIGSDYFVKIPKFWYKWTNGDTLKLQISNKPRNGFNVSPAHASRGDGKGERDYVYVGRFHCDYSAYSKPYSTPWNEFSISESRNAINNRGITGYYIFDYAMLSTIRMLYLVEFADWNCQEKIGYGCGNNSAPENASTVLSAQYHTGTPTANKQTYGVGVQYRYIADLWGNVRDWCDGIYAAYGNIYVALYPQYYVGSYAGQATGYTKLGTAPVNVQYNVIKSFAMPEQSSNYHWALRPNIISSDSNYDTYICDGYYLQNNTSYYATAVGGGYGRTKACGLFETFFYSGSSEGYRLQYLP